MEEEDEEILINIHWYGCKGTVLTEEEVKDIENFFDAVLNDETYFDDSDAWVMEVLLFQVFLSDDMKYLFSIN